MFRFVNILSRALLLFAFLGRNALAVPLNSGAGSIWTILQDSIVDNVELILTRLLAAGSPVLLLGQSLFLGFFLIMFIIHVVNFMKGGVNVADLMGDKGIVYFLVSSLAMFGLLFIPGSSYYGGVSSVWLGTIAYDVYASTLEAGPRILATALGLSDAAATNGVEVIFKFVFKMQFVDETGNWGWNFLYLIVSAVISALFIIVGIAVFAYTTIMPLALALSVIASVFIIPLAVFPFGRVLALNLIKAIIGVILAFIMVWLMAGFIISMYAGLVSLDPNFLSYGWLDGNVIEVPIKSAKSLVGPIVVPILSLMMLRVVPSLASALVGVGSNVTGMR